jgi:hypothetical protein
MMCAACLLRAIGRVVGVAQVTRAVADGWAQGPACVVGRDTGRVMGGRFR